jgi:wyosine [tRNA(Phe)-imidazoG37] synthetase (radical SAM superfamily)
MRAGRRVFYDPEAIFAAVRERLEEVRSAGEAVDYLTFVPDGEPTQELGLGRQIGLVKRLGVPMAVISNASLIDREDVRRDLLEADWVSLKVDAVDDAVWRRVDRPLKTLRLPAILEGALQFARVYRGILVTETMLVAGVNDGEASLRGVAAFLARLRPKTAYLSIPTRPPAEGWVQPPSEGVVNRGYQVLCEQVEHVEHLTGYEGNAFASTGDVVADVLGITAVQPMRREAVDALLQAAGADGSGIRRLVAEGRIVETTYAGHAYYMRRFPRAAAR